MRKAQLLTDGGGLGLEGRGHTDERVTAARFAVEGGGGQSPGALW